MKKSLSRLDMAGWSAIGLLGLGILGLAAGSAPDVQGAEKWPRPTGQELTKAEKAVQEVFGRDMQKAQTPRQKVDLAREILRAAREEQDPALRFAALQVARRLAVSAQDGRLGLEIVREIVDRFQPLEEMPPADRLAEADRLWQQAERLGGQEKLEKQLEAAETYLHIADHCLGRFGMLDRPIVYLRAQDATLLGQRITYSAQLDCILQWVNPTDSLLWEHRLLPGKYEVVCEYAADSRSSFASLFSLELNSRSVLKFRLQDTGRWPTFKSVSCGVISVPSNHKTLQLKVLQKIPPDPNMGIIALRALQLIPCP